MLKYYNYRYNGIGTELSFTAQGKVLESCEGHTQSMIFKALSAVGSKYMERKKYLKNHHLRCCF